MFEIFKRNKTECKRSHNSKYLNSNLNSVYYSSIENPYERFYDYYHTLIVQNEELMSDLDEAMSSRQSEIQFVRSLTKGQWLCVVYNLFDAEIGNGGVSQLYLNQPHYAIEVRDMIRALCFDDITSLFDNILRKAGGVRSKTQMILTDCDNHSPVVFEAASQAVQDIAPDIDGRAFESLYYPKYTWDEDAKRTVMHESNCRLSFCNALVSYVESNSEEFQLVKIQ